MGYQFQVRDANVVAYLTRETVEEPPRLTGDEISLFLETLMHHQEALITQDSAWSERISRIASNSYEKHSTAFVEVTAQDVDESLAEDALAGLRDIFREFDLYVLPIGVGANSHALTWLWEAALASKHHALVLIPSSHSGEALDIFDPTPPIKRLATNPERWPGVLFWTRGPGGVETFTSIREAQRLFERLSGQFDHGSEALSRPNRILQLSDLHFGTDEARRREAYFGTHLTQIMRDVDRVVITGDLLDSTRDQDFDRFYTTLSNSCRKDPILVAGNHDQRTYGNSIGPIGKNAAFLARIHFSPGVVVDDDIRCIFLVFNSAEKENFARGKVSKDQRLRVATRLQTEFTRHPHIQEYCRIALVHHHPIPYAPEEARPIQKGFVGLFVGAERFTEMRESKEFMLWCAKQNVPLVLHGHKHLPRHRREVIFENDRFLREITAVGCGASLGKGTERLSYNIVTLDPDAERWSATFHSGSVDGGGFDEDFVTLYQGDLEPRYG
ncbi:metallophosphoesterase [Streptomyces canus]|uniref:metallophosphoesterase family protein n=1 Tax=Streptomyces canus TaxID=58343 RepID=UPI0033BE167D